MKPDGEDGFSQWESEVGSGIVNGREAMGGDTNGNTDAPWHPHRVRAVSYVQNFPGACIQEVADYLGLTRNAAAHHLHILEQDGVLESLKQGRRSLYFPPEINNPIERTALGLLRQHTVHRILAELYREPTLPWRTLAWKIGKTPHTVRWHMHRLREVGLIHIESFPEDEIIDDARKVYISPVVRSYLDSGEDFLGL